MLRQLNQVHVMPLSSWSISVLGLDFVSQVLAHFRSSGNNTVIISHPPTRSTRRVHLVVLVNDIRWCENYYRNPGKDCSTNIRFHKKVKWFPYRPGVAQRVGRGIALLFHDCGTRRGWVVSSTPGLHFTPGKDPVPILQEAGWAPGPVWKGGKSRPHRDSIPDLPARSQSLYRLSYPVHQAP